MRYSVEVCPEPTQSTTAKGALLETLATDFLATQGLTSIDTNVRLTAMEVDVVANDEKTGETIFVECKAYRSNISSDVITKLLGNVTFRDASAGWLITTYAFGKDAKGFEEEWRKKPPEMRRKLRFFPPDEFVDRLIKAGLIALKNDAAAKIDNSEVYLLITPRGQIWALPEATPGSSLTSIVRAFNSQTGNAINDLADLAYFKSLDSSLADHTWLQQEASLTASASSNASDELDNIVQVPVAENWTDYRPSRPTDFVGRVSIQKDIFAFLDRVRKSETKIRTVALKAPSGWGKSSSVIKVADRSRNRRHKTKYFIFPIDSRSARTARFPEIGLIATIKTAIADGFVHFDGTPVFGTGANIFETDDAQKILSQLKSEDKVIIAFFDQFEELLYRDDLSSAFDQFTTLVSTVEAAQPNIAIGFSWKTDGSILTDHPAYHLWHKLADRRFEMELPPFSETEVNLAISRFSEELGEPINRQLSRLLRDHCQGYPWLLKKLCVHIFEQVRSGVEQSDLLSKGLSIENLFKKDLEGLNASEAACVKYVALNSPAEFYKVAENFDEQIVAGLVSKRIIVRSGTRLTLYWDIFRDYVLTEKIPFVPLTYIPQSNLSTYRKSLGVLLDAETIKYSDLSQSLALSSGATDNLVRDLVNLGLAEADRKKGTIIRAYGDLKEAVSIVSDFWVRHEAYRLISRDFGDQTFSFDEFLKIFRETLRRSEFSEKTVNIYANKILDWIQTVNLISRVQGGYRINRDRAAITDFVAVDKRRGAVGEFMAPTSPESALEALRGFGPSVIPVEEALNRFGKNSISALSSLGLVYRRPGGLQKVVTNITDEEFLRNAAQRQISILFVKNLIDGNPDISGAEIGKSVADVMSFDWKEASQVRTGNALGRWARWTFGLQSKRAPRIR